MTQPSLPVARSGFVRLLVHENHAADAVGAYFAATAPEAFDRMRGSAGEDAPRNGYKVDGGVALIPVMGALIPRGTFAGSPYGVTSYEGFAAELRRAAKDPAVDRIALMVDSPGGYVSGLDGAANAVRAAAAVKPTVAYVQGMACSAAYWLASACQEIVCSPQAELGSIGVVQAHFDMSAMLKEIGIGVTLIHAGAKKVDGNPYEPLSDRVKAEMTQRCEELRMSFAEAVAAGRASLDVAAVLATEAATFVGADAVKRGLADRVGFLADDLPDSDDPLVITSPLGRFMEHSMLTQAQLDAAVAEARKAAHAEGHAAGKVEGLAAGRAEGHTEGLKAGATAERDRFKAIRGCDAAKKRPMAAEQVALATDLSADAAMAFLAGMPEEAAAAKPIATLEAEMAGAPKPAIGADGGPAPTGNKDADAFAEGATTAKRLLGKK